MARTRLLKPTFFSDEIMTGLPLAARLTYMGLWTLADDAGYFDVSASEIRMAVWPGETRARGLKLVQEALARLVTAKRVQLLDCGDHAVIPRMADHRIKGGEQLYTIQKRHDRRCSVGLRRTTEPPSDEPDGDGLRRTTDNYVPRSESDSVSSSGSGSDSLDAQARPRSFDDAMAAVGEGLPFVQAHRQRRATAGA